MNGGKEKKGWKERCNCETVTMLPKKENVRHQEGKQSYMMCHRNGPEKSRETVTWSRESETVRAEPSLLVKSVSVALWWALIGSGTVSDLHMFAIVTGVSEYHVAGLVGSATGPSEGSPGITSSSASLAPVSSLQYSQTLISPYLSLGFPVLLFISLCFKNIFV